MSQELIPGHLFGDHGKGSRIEKAFQLILEIVQSNGGQITNLHAVCIDGLADHRLKIGSQKYAEADFADITRSFFGICEVSNPSTDVGIKIGLMIAVHKIPVLALRHGHFHKHSPALEHLKSGLFHLQEYRDLEEVTTQTAKFMQKVVLPHYRALFTHPPLPVN